MIAASQTPKRMMRKPSGELVPVPENGIVPDGHAIVAPMQIADAQDDRLRRAFVDDEKDRRFTFNDGAAGGTEEPIAAASDLFARGTADGLTSSQVAAIVVAAETALAALRKRAAGRRAAALDPAFASDAVATASAEAAAIDFEADRMENCVMRLRDRAKALAADEADAPKWERFKAAKAARDASEQAIKDEYPALAEKIAALLRRAVEADKLVGVANGHLPRDTKPLPWTHDIARQARVGPVLLPACSHDDHEHWPGNAHVV